MIRRYKKERRDSGGMPGAGPFPELSTYVLNRSSAPFTILRALHHVMCQAILDEVLLL